MAYHNSLSTPSAWARLSKHGGLDVNSISREEAEDLVSQIAVLEEQLNESEGNYEKLYSEYEKAKTYYKEVEASIETASQAYLDEKEQLQAQGEVDKVAIANLKAQVDEQRQAKESLETQLAAAQEQLKQAQDEAAAANKAREELSAELAAALQVRNDAQEAIIKARKEAQEELERAREESQETLRKALEDGEESREIAINEAQELARKAFNKAEEDVEKAEAAAVAAQEEARAAKEAAAAQLVLFSQKEQALQKDLEKAKEAAKIAREISNLAEQAAAEAVKAADIAKQEADEREKAWRVEQAAAKQALQEQERQLRERAADLDNREAALEGIRAAVSRQDGVPYGSRDFRERTEAGFGPVGLATGGTTGGPRPSRSNQRARLTTHQPAVELTAPDDGEEVMQQAPVGMHIGAGAPGDQGRDGVATGTHEGPQELASSRGHPDGQTDAPAVNKPEAVSPAGGGGGSGRRIENSDSDAPSALGIARRTTGRIRKRATSQISDDAAAVGLSSQPEVVVVSVGQKRGRGRPRKISNAGDHSDEEGAASSGISESASDVTEGTRQRRRARAGVAVAVAPTLPTVDEEEEVFFDAEEGPLEEPVQRPAKRTKTSSGGTSNTPGTARKSTVGRKKGSTSAAAAENAEKTAGKTSTAKKNAGRKKAVPAAGKAEPVGRRTRSTGHV